ncbi:MAG: hypothetical protein ACM3X9_02870 [Bacillota bacterium]
MFNDVAAVELIRSLYQPLSQITEALSDTMMLAGSEAYSGSLSFYNSFPKCDALQGLKAETIYKDLLARFPAKAKKETAATKEG